MYIALLADDNTLSNSNESSPSSSLIARSFSLLVLTLLFKATADKGFCIGRALCEHWGLHNLRYWFTIFLVPFIIRLVAVDKIYSAGIAQLVEHLIRNERVVGSNPIIGSSKIKASEVSEASFICLNKRLVCIFVCKSRQK